MYNPLGALRDEEFADRRDREESIKSLRKKCCPSSRRQRAEKKGEKPRRVEEFAKRPTVSTEEFAKHCEERTLERERVCQTKRLPPRRVEEFAKRPVPPRGVCQTLRVANIFEARKSFANFQTLGRVCSETRDESVQAIASPTASITFVSTPTSKRGLLA